MLPPNNLKKENKQTVKQKKPGPVALKMQYDVDRVLKILKKNKQRHREQYQKSLAGYKNELERKFMQIDEELSNKMQKFAAKLQNGEHLKINLSEIKDIKTKMSRPYAYTSYYNTAIEMLEKTSAKTVVLSRTQFKELIQDKWFWKDTFNKYVKKYANKA